MTPSVSVIVQRMVLLGTISADTGHFSAVRLASASLCKFLAVQIVRKSNSSVSFIVQVIRTQVQCLKSALPVD